MDLLECFVCTNKCKAKTNAFARGAAADSSRAMVQEEENVGATQVGTSQPMPQMRTTFQQDGPDRLGFVWVPHRTWRQR